MNLIDFARLLTDVAVAIPDAENDKMPGNNHIIEQDGGYSNSVRDFSLSIEFPSDIPICQVSPHQR